jgi:hypothetical protein
MTDDYVLATMYWAKDIAFSARSRFALDNLDGLILRFKLHSESKNVRRRAMLSQTIACRNIAIAQQQQYQQKQQKW